MAAGARQFAFNGFAGLKQTRFLLVIGFGAGVTRRLSRLLNSLPERVSKNVIRESYG
jgi:hypothetical protein